MLTINEFSILFQKYLFPSSLGRGVQSSPGFKFLGVIFLKKSPREVLKPNINNFDYFSYENR